MTPSFPLISSNRISFLGLFLLRDLHLCHNLFSELLQLVLVTLLLRPRDTQAFLFAWLGDHVEVDVIDNLMSDASIVLQDVVVLGIYGLGDLLCDRQDLRELVVGDVVEFCAVVLGNDKLGVVVRERER